MRVRFIGVHFPTGDLVASQAGIQFWGVCYENKVLMAIKMNSNKTFWLEVVVVVL